MNDPVLKRIWKAREAISQRCGFDARSLIRFYQSRQKPAEQAGVPQQEACGGLAAENAVSRAGSPAAGRKA